MGDATQAAGRIVAAHPGLMERLARGTWTDAPLQRPLAILLFGQAVLIAYLFAGTQGWIVPLDHPVSPDYLSFYSAGLLAGQGHGLAAYDRAAHFAMQQAVLAPGIEYQWFLYPPPFLLVCAVLAKLPWAWSFAVFELVTAAGCMAVLRAVLGLRWRVCLVGLLAFPAVPWVFLLGQNSFLTAGLFAGGLLLLPRRPVLAGLLLSGLACKPHFALLIPVALAAGGHWRAFAAAAAGLLALCALPVLFWGWEIWPAYFASFTAAAGSLRAGQVGRFSAMVAPYGVLRAFAVPHGWAMLVQGVAAATATGLVALLWRRRAAFALRAAALLSAALVAVPFGLFYDLVLVLASLCWLGRHGCNAGFPRWSKTLMGACWLLPLPPLFIVLGAPETPLSGLVAPALLWLCWHWYRHDRAYATSLDPRFNNSKILSCSNETDSRKAASASTAECRTATSGRDEQGCTIDY